MKIIIAIAVFGIFYFLGLNYSETYNSGWITGILAYGILNIIEAFMDS